MSSNFMSGGKSHKITIYPALTDRRKHSIIIVLHGNAGLNPPFGSQIQYFAQSLAARGYVTAVPQYYIDDAAHLDDDIPHPYVPVLSDAIANVASRPDADPERLGLVGYSLGAAVAMTYIASNTAGKSKVFVDFFGPIKEQNRSKDNGVIVSGVAKFPPTIIFHSKEDKIVTLADNSERLNKMLPNSVEHRLVTYAGDTPEQGFHPFKEKGLADLDSQKRATEWVLKYLPPTK